MTPHQHGDTQMIGTETSYRILSARGTEYARFEFEDQAQALVDHCNANPFLGLYKPYRFEPVSKDAPVAR